MAMMKRAVALYTAMAVMIWALSLRIALLGGSEYKNVSAINSSRSEVVAVSRGYIYDKNYIPLVNGERTHCAAILPYEGIESALEGLASQDAIENALTGPMAVLSVKYLRADTANIKYFDRIVRYPEDSCAVHLIGYTDAEGGKGISGLEKSFDELLYDCSGQLSVSYKVDGKGLPIASEPLTLSRENYDSKGGLLLTLDSRIQRICEDAAGALGLDKGAVIVLRADTSEIAALASFPAFSREDLGKSLTDENAPFLNRALEPFAVGSVFKVVTAAAALESGIDPSWRYECTGSIDVGGIIFHCHQRDGHGELDMSGATAKSCNTYFIALALQIGAERLLSQAKAFGFGKSIMPADGLSAKAGSLPDETEMQNIGALANLAFGQGSLSASPLEMAAVYACIASGGIYTPPYVLSAKLNNNGDIVERYRPEAGVRVISEGTAAILQSFLTDTVENGSGAAAKPDGLTAAGKTATAQSGQYRDGEEILRTWFCGYFPAEEPAYVVVVIKEEGTSPITDCAPIFKQIAERITALNSGRSIS